MSPRSLLRLTLTAWLLASSARADVLYVDATGRGDFTSLQAAVDAAQDGDVLLVRTGVYAPFVVDGKALWIGADAGAAVQVDGRVVVRQVAEDQDLVLAGLQLAGEDSGISPREALRIEGSPGDVRIEGCTLTGGKGVGGANCSAWPAGGHGLRIATSDSVVLVGCTVVAGNGQGSSNNEPECVSGKGGIGTVLEAADAWFFECTIRGGGGGNNLYQAADGGEGLFAAVGSRAFLSGGLVQGGKGGIGWETIDGYPGDGGNGAHASSNSTIEHVDCELLGGQPGGSISQGLGAPGAPQSGPGTFTAHPGAARSLAGPTLVPAFVPTTVQYTGEPGDQVWLLAARAADLHATPGAVGDWLVQFPLKLTQSPHAVLGTTGTATLQVPAVQLPAGSLSGALHVQALVRDGSGQLRFSGVLAMRALDCAGLAPDCDGDGSADTCDLLAGAPDCDLDGLPDACEPDCNANGQADDCDIASGGSQDFNRNGIPDECEGFGMVWYVDDDAPAGGDGSAGAPFQTLAQAFAVSLSAHTIELADGTYTGPGNGSQASAGRDLHVRSANGPGQCVIDLQGQARAFHVTLGETLTLTGLTIRNGSATTGGAVYVENGELIVQGCRFESCVATGSSISSGGAIATRFLGPGTRVLRIAGSKFSGCGARIGGAINADSAILEMEGCSFESNWAEVAGGAINLLMQGGNARIAQSRFLGNATLHEGGAVRSGSISDVHRLEIGDCLFAGGSAAQGGGIYSFNDLEVRDSTLAANTGSLRGGAIWVDSDDELHLANSVLWDNASPEGAALALGFPLNGADAVVTHSLVQGGQAGVFQGAGSTLTWLGGNLDVDPLFADADGPDGDPLTLQDNDWRLSAGSPALDAGDNAEVPPDLLDLDGDLDLLEPLPYDLDGGPRFVDDIAPDTGSGTAPLVDLGAYERD